MSTETIYQSLYVQSRGALRRELTGCLRTGRALRQPGRRTGQRKNRIPDMVNISKRPPEANDRAVPGHWEGDLLIGKRNATAIATPGRARHRLCDARCAAPGLQARPRLGRTRCEGPDAARGAAALADLGPGPRDARLEAGPHRRWHRGLLLRSPPALQRGTNENTNGPPRQYFPKGTDFSRVSEAHLDAVADELNDRPRKRLRFYKPTDKIADLPLR